MKQFLLPILMMFCLSDFASAQLKNVEPSLAPKMESATLVVPPGYQSMTARSAKSIFGQKLGTTDVTDERVRRIQYRDNGTPNWIETNPVPINSGASIERQAKDYLHTMRAVLRIENAHNEFELISNRMDAQGNHHIKFGQLYKGLPVDGAEIVVHSVDQHWYLINGYTQATPNIEKIETAVSIEQAKSIVRADLRNQDVNFKNLDNIAPLKLSRWQYKLVIFHAENHQEPHLAYRMDCRPNVKDHYVMHIDALNGEILQQHNHICTFMDASHKLTNNGKKEESLNSICTHDQTLASNETSSLTVMDGPTVVTDTDLSGVNRQVNGYRVDDVFFMIDASRTGMFNGGQSTLPNEPVGAVWTIDAKGTSPENNNFSVSQVANNNNNWSPLEVSAHYNGGEAYEYFINTHNRNSINGEGGNIVSIINITDENENEADNAFWNGVAIFYGNGITAFTSPLARAADVAGHEMSHGVIQGTANLEYVAQSGALNESFADVFGAMIDRDDWQVGEDVVNTNIFTTGALRDISNPNNGGTKFGDDGWQPKHMDEYVNLPNTPQGDNGGVHINSGIVNFAFFKFASAVGKAKAEKVYFKALEDYLVRSSQFVDARNAVVQAAEDLYGQAEVDAAKDAFSQVGIGEGSGGNYQEDLNTNPGDDIVICTDQNSSAFYYVPPSNPNSAVTLTTLTPPRSNSRMSMTDDGSLGVYVDENDNLRYVRFNWSQTGPDPEIIFLENSPQGGWRNIVISKDGSRVAYQSANLENRIFFFDFDLNDGTSYELFNPTTAQGGGTTGDVQFADAMEFDYSGEVLVYDAQNKLSGSFGDDIEYWDISFIQYWDNNANDFVNQPQIAKLFTTLPENVSVGNPTFSKNSPFIMAFDFLETTQSIFGAETEYILKAANLQTGQVSDVFNNQKVSYPSYSRLDDKILFDANNTGGDAVLATVDVEPSDKITPIANTAVVFAPGGARGTWSQTGERSLMTSTEPLLKNLDIRLYPNPSSDFIFIEGNDVSKIDRWEMFNVQGQQMNGSIGPLQSNKIDISKFSAGLYKLVLYSTEGLFQTSISKQE